MVRLASDLADRPLSMTWDGTAATARAIIDWSRDEAGNTRFAWLPMINAPDEARVFVQYPFPQSDVWERCPVGTVIVRADDTEGALLSLRLPPPEPFTILKESA